MTSGTISSIKARIPWPNPLASTLGFSLKSLHLVFHVVPYSQRVNVPDIGLSESVASVAESFIHQELSPGEEATLWQSLHQDVPQPDVDTDQSVPGGLDDSTTVNETARMFDQDPAGVSVFASLIERLLARFEFDADDIKITLIHPDNVSLTMSVEELRYHTDGSSGPSSGQARGETRTVSIGGFVLSTHDLHVQESFLRTTTDSPHSNPLSIATSRPLSRTSSSSSIDEATQFMMSQSLAALPSSPLSSASSVASLYESAISTAAVPSGQEEIMVSAPTFPKEESESQDETDEKFMSLEAQPILVHLTTPSPVPGTLEDDDPFVPPIDSDSMTGDQLHLSISIGIMALVTRPWQIRALLRLCNAMLPPEDNSQDTFESKENSAVKLPSIKFDIQIRGIVALFLARAAEGHMSADVASLLDFFEKPLVPPPLPTSYTRLHLDALSGSLTIIKGDQLKYDNTSPSLVQSLDINMSDLSLFFFKKAAELSDTDATLTLSAFPLLHTDPLLLSQYPHEGTQPQPGESSTILPVFEIVDWTDEKCKSFGAKLSQWRCRPAKGSQFKSHSDSQGVRTTVEVNASSTVGRPALRISGRQYMKIDRKRRASIETSENLDIHVAPLNIRFDFAHLLQTGSPLAFLEELLPLETQDDDQFSQSSQETVDMSFSTWEGRPLVAQSDYLDKSRYNSGNLVSSDCKCL